MYGYLGGFVEQHFASRAIPLTGFPWSI